MIQHQSASAEQAGREDAEQGHFPPAAGTETEPEDPVGSVNEQQLVQGSPTAVSGGAGREEGGGDGELAAGASGGGGEATLRMPPPPPPALSSQPLPFIFHEGYPTEQQTGVANVSFATESADATTVMNASRVNPGLSSSASVPAPPIPPPIFNPYYAPFRSPYHVNPYSDTSPMSHPAYGGVPSLGPGFAPNFPHGHFPNSPLLRPNHLPGYPYRSPMSYPPPHRSPMAAMFGSPGHGPHPPAQFAPPFPPHPPPPRVTPYPPSLMHHLPPLAHPSFGGHVPPLPSFPPVVGFNAGLADGSGPSNAVRPSTLLPSQAQFRGGPFSKVAADDGYGLHSPSGTTAASLQVQPPSSPPSIPSINLQQPSASNLNNCNAASVAMPNLTTTNPSTGATASLPVSTSTTGGTTLQIPALSPTVGANSTPALMQSSLAASNSGVSTLELGPGPGPGPDTASSFPTLVKPIDFTKETGAASLLAWKGQAFGGVPSGPVTTSGGKIIMEGAAEGDHQLVIEKDESVSSLPVSIPEELRFCINSIHMHFYIYHPLLSLFSSLGTCSVRWLILLHESHWSVFLHVCETRINSHFDNILCTKTHAQMTSRFIVHFYDT